MHGWQGNVLLEGKGLDRRIIKLDRTSLDAIDITCFGYAAAANSSHK